MAGGFFCSLEDIQGGLKFFIQIFFFLHFFAIEFFSLHIWLLKPGSGSEFEFSEYGYEALLLASTLIQNLTVSSTSSVYLLTGSFPFHMHIFSDRKDEKIYS
jgi:hypothetical protein